ncbi:very short patch repair endonuclease [Mesorhizobium ventifaucium]|nr:DNA mismatch endonuclease Vsr [Mesorhizobium ventifaucium]
MTDNIYSEQRSAVMRAVRAKNTAPERIVRSILHRSGYRFRLHRSDLPGKPDIVLPSRRAVIMVHGCFWHSHSDPACNRARQPKSRVEYWKPKLARNAARDQIALDELEAQGWRTLVIWECELGNLDVVKQRLVEFLGASPSSSGR